MKIITMYRHKGRIVSYEQARLLWQRGQPFDFLNIREQVWRRVRLATFVEAQTERKYVVVEAAPEA